MLDLRVTQLGLIVDNTQKHVVCFQKDLIIKIVWLLYYYKSTQSNIKNNTYIDVYKISYKSLVEINKIIFQIHLFRALAYWQEVNQTFIQYLNLK